MPACSTTAPTLPETIYNMDMGYASAVALGVALACPKRRVLAIEGEGSFFAGSTVLSTAWRMKPDNLVVLVLDNGVWGTGDGKEPTATSFGLDLLRLALAAGWDAAQVHGPAGRCRARRARGPGAQGRRAAFHRRQDRSQPGPAVLLAQPAAPQASRARLRRSDAGSALARWLGRARCALGLLGWSGLAAVALVCVLPVVVITLGSFSDGNPFNDFQPSLEPWRRALDSSQTLVSIGYSFLLSLRVPVALVVAFFVAWYLARNDVFGKRTHHVRAVARLLPADPAGDSRAGSCCSIPITGSSTSMPSRCSGCTARCSTSIRWRASPGCT